MEEKHSPECEEFLSALAEVVMQPIRNASAEGNEEQGGAQDPEKARGWLAGAFARITDPRREHLRVHSLVSLLQVAVAAMLSGAKSVYAIGQWTAERFKNDPQSLEALGVKPGRYPSGPTFHRVFKRLDASMLAKAAGASLSQGAPLTGVTIGIDGKTARGTMGYGNGEGAHLVSASVVQTNVVMAQQVCPGKGKELPTGKEVLKDVPMKGNLLTGDALYMQRDICTDVVDRGGDYLFPVKGNQPELLASIERAFTDLHLDAAPKLPERVADWFAQKDAGKHPKPLPIESLLEPLLPPPIQRMLDRMGVEVTAYLDAPRRRAHGRFERREVWVIHSPDLNRHAGEAGDAGKPWPHVEQMCWIKRERVTREKAECEITYAATSLPPQTANAERVANELRGYWGAVENGLHCVRDVTMGEDKSQVHEGAGAAVMAALRNVALGVLRRLRPGSVAAGLRALGWKPRDAVDLVLRPAST